MSKSKPRAKKPRKPAADRDQPMQRLRTLGDVENARTAGPRRRGANADLARKARAVLEAEFDRVIQMKEKLHAEAAVGGREKGRDAIGKAEKVRAMIASLEGMNRFALQMKLITPAESRQIYTSAMKRGLYEGWR